MDAAPTKISTVQAARGAAALLVLFYHLQSTAPKMGLGSNGILSLFSFGHAGVEFFFVLSGFIIYYIHRKDLGKTDKIFNFAWKRITRIYPLFWAIMTIYVIKFIHQGDFSWDLFIKSLLLLPQTQTPMLPASWTLAHEMAFYCFFATAIAHFAFGRFVMLFWLAAIVGNLLAGATAHPIPTGLLDFITSPFNLLFYVGMFVAYALLDKKWRVPNWLAYLGMAGFFGVGMAEHGGWIAQESAGRIMLFGICSGLTLAGLVSGEMSGRFRLGAVGTLLGDLSYPLYLSHTAVVGVIFSLFAAAKKPFPLPAIALACLVAAVCVALLLNRAIERPSARLLGRIRSRFRAFPLARQDESAPAAPSSDQ